MIPGDSVFENIFETVNSGFAQAVYEDYLRDPSSVPEEWRRLFERGMTGERPTVPTEGGSGAAAQAAHRRPVTVSPDRDDAETISGPALRLVQNMEASLQVPTATSFRDIDVSGLWRVRAAFNHCLQERSLKLSFTHFIGWAIVRAVQQYPSMAHVLVRHGDDYRRVVSGAVNLGLAVDTVGKQGERRLLVPVIRDVGQMTFDEFHAEYERLVDGARNNRLLPDSYMGANMTLTNPGPIGTVASVPRLMQGQGSIIATGAIREVGATRIMTVTSTYDHRIIQGAESGLFLQVIDRLLQNEEDFYKRIATAMGIEELAADSAIETAMAPAALPSLPESTDPAHSTRFLHHVSAAAALVECIRTHGYLAARLDPLGTPPAGDPALECGNLGLTPEIMRQIPAQVLHTYVGGETFEDALPRLRDTYCGTIAYEIEHIANPDERVWLRRVIESGEHRYPLSDEEKEQLLSTLTHVDVLERFLHRTYVGHKRFGIEGLDMLVPVIHRALDIAAGDGACECVMGMAHRGRLNVLAHVLGVSYEHLLAEFEGGREVEETLTPKGGTGDVKYHHGSVGLFRTAQGDEIQVTLMPNPSHLEAVSPVVEGFARARQTDRSGTIVLHQPASVLPILVHGDAAFPAQGVVAETLNLARLKGYGTGGTLHIIANNQVGFTTSPSEASSTDFASDLAKGFDVPIVHVNADDPEACLSAVHLAMRYRQKFGGDVVVNLVGYRRHGHNEGDEPRYTQPLMYERIDTHPPLREIYAKRLSDQDVVRMEDAQAQFQRVYDELADTVAKLRRDLERTSEEGEEPVRIFGLSIPLAEPVTAKPLDALQAYDDELYAIPEGFRINRKLERTIERKRAAMREGVGLDWAHAEVLAFASLLTEGVPVRLVGQDVARGTFSQRHLTWFDAVSGLPFTPMQHLSTATAPFELHNSPLSEYAALGFEYGYSVAATDELVLWEAQFGDFANVAEVIIDQFIVAGLAKWGQTSRLTLLLPHGYEGQGPEHSSARLERYLALGAEGNIRVANCSTPAQYFHLLRRQAKHPEIRPLIVMTPKSLLRLPQATSAPSDLTDSEFWPVLDDPSHAGERDDVTRLVLCTGKIYYDVAMAERRADAKHVAVGRLELLYPFPESQVSWLIESYPNVREIVWLQEEPMNMGARKWVIPALNSVTEGIPTHYVSRPERSSPAEGYPAAHVAEQQRLVSEALK